MTPAAGPERTLPKQGCGLADSRARRGASRSALTGAPPMTVSCKQPGPVGQDWSGAICPIEEARNGRMRIPGNHEKESA